MVGLVTTGLTSAMHFYGGYRSPETNLQPTVYSRNTVWTLGEFAVMLGGLAVRPRRLHRPPAVRRAPRHGARQRRRVRDRPERGAGPLSGLGSRTAWRRPAAGTRYTGAHRRELGNGYRARALRADRRPPGRRNPDGVERQPGIDRPLHRPASGQRPRSERAEGTLQGEQP